MARTKIGRSKRRAGVDGSFRAFVRNKWNGIEPIQNFFDRENKLFARLNHKFKTLGKQA